jgi:hypothetical protein
MFIMAIKIPTIVKLVIYFRKYNESALVCARVMRIPMIQAVWFQA